MVLLIGCAIGAFDGSERREPVYVAEDTSTSTTPTEPPGTIPAPAPPSVCVNELMADNEGAVAGEDGTPADWVELYNPTSGRVDLDGWTLGDDTPTALDGLSLDPGRTLLLWADGRAVTGHLADTLDADGGELTLTTPEGGAAHLTWGGLQADWAAARTAPCGPDWTWSWHGTPGYDNGGAVTAAWVGATDVWSYLDTGVAPDTTWATGTFDDSTWPTGPAPLGYGDTTISTTVSDGGDPANRFVTTWLRRRFTASAGARVVTLRIQVDDGAIVFLNGEEVARFNLPSYGVTPSTFALVSTPSEASWWRFDVDPALLVDGENILAVEVHQHSSTSSDIGWSATLTAEDP